jgi:hypothetical protein
MRQGRYRYQMIEQEQLNQWAPALSRLFNDWRASKEAGRLRDWELVGLYLVVFVFLHRPREKWRPAARVFEPREGCWAMVEQTGAQHLKSLVSDEKAREWAACASWVWGAMPALRGVPEKVLRSLRGWRAGRFPLRLFHRVPLAMELLQLQVLGERCVSLLLAESEIQQAVEEGRDVWSFALHDLLHADHFFGQPEWIGSQRFLSDLFLRVLQSEFFIAAQDIDPEYRAALEYVAADMNAHPVFIFLSFHAKTLEHFKRQKAVSLSSKLSIALETEWREFWCRGLKTLALTPTQWEVFADMGKTKRMTSWQSTATGEQLNGHKVSSTQRDSNDQERAVAMDAAVLERVLQEAGQELISNERLRRDGPEKDCVSEENIMN